MMPHISLKIKAESISAFGTNGLSNVTSHGVQMNLRLDS